MNYNYYSGALAAYVSGTAVYNLACVNCTVRNISYSEILNRAYA